MEKRPFELSKQEAEIRQLRAKLLRIENSISWRITRPLRMLSRRYPTFALACVDKVALAYSCFKRIVLFTSSRSCAGKVWAPAADCRQQIDAYRARDHSCRRYVVYTAIFGEYDRLLLPEYIDPEVDYVCFTDRSLDTFGVWSLRPSPYYHPDPTRIARYIKTHPHTLFQDYSYAVWIDANVILRAPPKKYIEMLATSGKSLGLIRHPHRDCVYEEAEACKLRAKDAKSTIDEQVGFYKSQGMEEHRGLYETGFMVVDLANRPTISLFATWWDQIRTFSRRDQIGLAWSIKAHPLEVLNLLPSGVSVREDEDFTYFSHSDSHRLRTPDELHPFSKIQAPDYGKPFSADKTGRLAAAASHSIDIIICIHDALDDVKLCLSSVLEDLRRGHRLIVVNDCSAQPTTEYLRGLARKNRNITLIENESNLGYTKSANRGLSEGKSKFRIILNSDTIVTRNWALKLLDVALQSDQIGIVGPLSNAAGIQSIPYIRGTNSNTAINLIPDGLTYEEIDAFLENVDGSSTFPVVPLVHGFCMGIKGEVFEQIGYFDSENFERYYGEENDFCFRAAKAGYTMALATNTFVFHRKSRSILEEERLIHMQKAGQRLRELYGTQRIREACLQGEHHPALVRLREKVDAYFTKVRSRAERIESHP